MTVEQHNAFNRLGVFIAELESPESGRLDTLVEMRCVYNTLRKLLMASESQPDGPVADSSDGYKITQAEQDGKDEPSEEALEALAYVRSLRGAGA